MPTTPATSNLWEINWIATKSKVITSLDRNYGKPKIFAKHTKPGTSGHRRHGCIAVVLSLYPDLVTRVGEIEHERKLLPSPSNRSLVRFPISGVIIPVSELEDKSRDTRSRRRWDISDEGLLEKWLEERSRTRRYERLKMESWRWKNNNGGIPLKKKKKI